MSYTAFIKFILIFFPFQESISKGKNILSPFGVRAVNAKNMFSEYTAKQLCVFLLGCHILYSFRKNTFFKHIDMLIDWSSLEKAKTIQKNISQL
jgi:hypothetical protein